MCCRGSLRDDLRGLGICYAAFLQYVLCAYTFYSHCPLAIDSNILYSTLLAFSLFGRVVYASATLVTDFTRSLQHLANHGS
jgi:hypothetical protein